MKLVNYINESAKRGVTIIPKGWFKILENLYDQPKKVFKILKKLHGPLPEYAVR